MEMKIAHTHIFVIYQHSLAVFINCWVLARPLKWLALFKVQPAKKKKTERGGSAVRGGNSPSLSHSLWILSATRRLMEIN